MKKVLSILSIISLLFLQHLYVLANEQTIAKPRAMVVNRAIKHGDTNKVKMYIDAGFNLNKKYWTTWLLYGTPIIGTAISSKQNEVLDLMLKNGASANPKSIVPPLHVAIICKNPYAVDRLLQAGANTDDTYMGMTAEKVAIAKNYTDIIAVFQRHKEQIKHKLNIHKETQIAGIGIELYKDKNRIFVIRVIKDSPAHHAYLPVGAQLLEVNNVKIKNMTINEVSDLIRGKSNTTVILLAKSKSGKNTYVIERKPLNLAYNANKKFDMYWKQVVPEQYVNVAYYEIMPQYSTKLKNEMYIGNYWANRKYEFQNGYNICMTYKKDEQNSCLMNLVNREITKTQYDRQIEMQEMMYRQQATQNFINNMNHIQTNMNLNNINNSIQQQNMQLQNTNMHLFNINNSLNRW